MIIGIDPSLTGFAMAFDGEPVRLYELSSKPNGKDAASRVNRYEDLIDLAEERIKEFLPDGRRPRLVIIEGYAHAKGQGAHAIGEFGGLLRRRLVVDFNVSIVEVAPSKLKKFATGKGNSPKSVVASHLTKRYGVAFDSDNQADAFGLLQMGRVLVGDVEPATKAQREAVAGLEIP